jgi:hypothetical protein
MRCAAIRLMAYARLVGRLCLVLAIARSGQGNELLTLANVVDPGQIMVEEPIADTEEAVEGLPARDSGRTPTGSRANPHPTYPEFTWDRIPLYMHIRKATSMARSKRGH